MKNLLLVILAIGSVQTWAANKKIPKCYSNVVNGIVDNATVFEPKTKVTYKLLSSKTTEVDVWDAPRVAFDYRAVELIEMEFEIKIKKPGYTLKTYKKEFEYYAYDQTSFVIYDNTYCRFQRAGNLRRVD